jgi:2-oxoisovalerate ferredoxin oxidoreductase beta subunit
VPEGGVILYDSTVIKEPGEMPYNRRILGVPFTGIAAGLQRPMVKNLAALGALQAATDLLPAPRFLETLREVLKDKPSTLPVNEAAFAAGQRAVAGMRG